MTYQEQVEEAKELFVNELNYDLKDFEDVYAGLWDNEDSFVIERLEEFDYLQDIPERLRQYLYQSTEARALLIGDYATEPASGGGVHVFLW